MRTLGTHSPDEVGTACANALVIRWDPDAAAANPYYWHRALPLVDDMLERLGVLNVPGFPEASAALATDVASREAWNSVRSTIAAWVRRRPRDAGPVSSFILDVASRTRLDYYIGESYGEAFTDEKGWSSRRGAPAASGSIAPLAQIVVPFRGDSSSPERIRNLMACLFALGDQTLERDSYRIVVVESDAVPLWAPEIRPLADDYIFAPSSTSFNKCWAVNVGVLNAAQPAPLVCVLDADALPDRDFVARNIARFRRPGTGALLPFRDLTYLDEHATRAAIDARCDSETGAVLREHTRGFLVHRAPGVCVWLRRDVFDAVGGMDERFEGWGREDLDFVLRLQLATAFDFYDDTTYHLHHPTAAQLKGGQTVNAHIPLLSWEPTGAIGDPQRYAGGSFGHGDDQLSVSDGLA